MPRMDTHYGHRASTVELLRFVLNGPADAIAALENRRRTIATRRAIAGLSAQQREDIGHAEAPAPVFEVKAGLITSLISMR